MRRVISHEIGHALGLPHNMKASAAYPVDSLRSGSFTQKMGIATTIMDYARYNYIAQPGDENIRFVRQLGPYDDYAIEWGYRYFEKETPETEKVFLNKMVDEKSLNPIYMFGYNQYDPDTQTENIGDDPVKASNYGLKNLKIVSQNLEEWTTVEGQSYEDLEEIYKELISVYRRYIYHVIRMIGGVNETLLTKGQNAMPYQNLAAAEQLQALRFLDQNLWKTPYWLIDKKLISKIGAQNALGSMQNIQWAALKRILSTERLNRMLSNQTALQGQALTIDGLLDYFYTSFFDNAPVLDDSFMALQFQLVSHLKQLKGEEKLNPRIRSSAGVLLEKIDKVAGKKKNTGTQLDKNHYRSLIQLISD